MITQNFDMEDYLKKDNDGTNFTMTHFGDYITPRDLNPYFSDPVAWLKVAMLQIDYYLGITDI